MKELILTRNHDPRLGKIKSSFLNDSLSARTSPHTSHTGGPLCRHCGIKLIHLKHTDSFCCLINERCVGNAVNFYTHLTSASAPQPLPRYGPRSLRQNITSLTFSSRHAETFRAAAAARLTKTDSSVAFGGGGLMCGSGDVVATWTS